MDNKNEKSYSFFDIGGLLVFNIILFLNKYLLEYFINFSKIIDIDFIWFVIFVLLVLIGIFVYERINAKTKYIIFIANVFIMFILALVPKEISGGGVTPEGIGGKGCKCIGIPYSLNTPTEPFCVGKLYDCRDYFIPRPLDRNF